MKTKRCEIQPRKLKNSDEAAEVFNRFEYIIRSKKYNMVIKVFESLINFFSIAYLQPPQRNFSNDVTND